MVLIMSKVTSVTLKVLRELVFPSSNIPMILIMSKVTLSLNQFVFTPKNRKFVRIKSNWKTKFQGLFNFLLFFLHSVLLLKWFLYQGLYPANTPMANWRITIMLYFLTVFSGIMIGFHHFYRIEKEVRLLLNSSIQIELDSKKIGK